MANNPNNYNNLDILRTFIKIKEPISRKDLTKELELGEGTIRTILDILKRKKLISSTRKGHFLTGKGSRLILEFKKKIDFPRELELKSFKKYKLAGILIKDKKIKPSYKERDLAVKNRAEGALIFTKNFNIYDHNFKELKNYYSLKNNTLIICFADSYKNAENAALAVANSFKNLKI